MSSTFFHSFGVVLGLEEAPRRAGGEPGVGAFLLEGVGDALVDALVLEDVDRPSPSRTKTVIGTPQARWREITQSGCSSIMPRMRFWPAGGTKRVSLMASSARSRAQR